MTALARRLGATLETSVAAQWFAAFVPLLLIYASSLRFVAMDMSADPTGVTPSAWGIAHRGTPIVAREDWPFFNPWFVNVGADEVVSNRAPGLVFFAAPFYWVFSSSDTWDPLPGSVAAAIITAAAMASLGVLVRRLIGPATGWQIGLATAFIASLATTTWTVSGTQLFPHGPDQFLMVMAMLGLAAHRLVLSGASFGAAVLFRPHLAIVAAVTGLWRSWAARRVTPAIVIGLGTAAGLALYIAYSIRYWGTVFGGGEGDEPLLVDLGALNPVATHGYFGSLADWSWPTLLDFLYRVCGALLSPGRGILVGAPFLLLLLPGLRRAWLSAPDWVRAAAVGGVLYYLVQLKGQIFTGGQYFWSYRYPLEMLTLCAPLLVLAWRRWAARRILRHAWFFALVAISIGMQAVGAIGFHGPYPDTPWTFDNFASALRSMGLPGYVLLAISMLLAVGILWRGYRRHAHRTIGPARAEGDVGAY